MLFIIRFEAADLSKLDSNKFFSSMKLFAYFVKYNVILLFSSTFCFNNWKNLTSSICLIFPKLFINFTHSSKSLISFIFKNPLSLSPAASCKFLQSFSVFPNKKLIELGFFFNINKIFK